MEERCFVLPSLYPLTCGLHGVVLQEFRVVSAGSMEEIERAGNYGTGHVGPVRDLVASCVMDV